jgi:hypothetical protein
VYKNARVHRLIIYDDVGDAPVEIGDMVEVIRGGGPRDGERIGIATIAWIDQPDDDVTIAIAWCEGGPLED